MSGPGRVPNWRAITSALAAAGCTLTPYGRALLGVPRKVCAWCKADMGPAPDTCTNDSHGMCASCAATFEAQIEA